MKIGTNMHSQIIALQACSSSRRRRQVEFSYECELSQAHGKRHRERASERARVDEFVCERTIERKRTYMCFRTGILSTRKVSRNRPAKWQYYIQNTRVTLLVSPKPFANIEDC